MEWSTSDANIQPNVQEATVARLRPAGHYQFRVFASNEVGEGLPSEPKPDTPIEMPQQRMSLVPISCIVYQQMEHFQCMFFPLLHHYRW